MVETTGKEVNNLFLIGAGFTKAVFPDAPLNKDLLPVLCKGAPCATLKRYYKEHKTNDIEILLTHLDLEILPPKRNRQTALQTDRKTIERKLAEYFVQFRFKEEIIANSIWLKYFVNLFQPNDAIISLNYDCLLEGVLDYYEVWSPSRGYGFADVKVDVPGTDFEKLPNPKNILIYKIHGSENFQTCGIKDVHIDPNHIGLVVNPEIYPKSGANTNLGVVKGRSYIIAPSFVKTFYPQIERMMIGALQSAGKANNFIIIGCGLRPEDSFLWLLLMAFLNQRTRCLKLVIVDPLAEEIKNKISEHYSGFISTPVNIKLIPKGIECSVEELIKELAKNTFIN
jgi:hypothetical protein